MIATSFHDRFTNPAARENHEKTVPLRRQGEADDIAGLVCYLAGEDSAYITGTNIDINGGAFFS
jgi:3-oxoacyl-[acyl-carrier protein] reductase